MEAATGSVSQFNKLASIMLTQRKQLQHQVATLYKVTMVYVAEDHLKGFTSHKISVQPQLKTSHNTHTTLCVNNWNKPDWSSYKHLGSQSLKWGSYHTLRNRFTQECPYRHNKETQLVKSSTKVFCIQVHFPYRHSSLVNVLTFNAVSRAAWLYYFPCHTRASTV